MEEVWNSFDYLQSKSTTSPENCVIIDATGVTKIKQTDTKFYVPVAGWWTKGNKKLLEKLKSGLKITINWKNIQSNVSTQTQNHYSCNLIDPRVNIFFCVIIWPYIRYFIPVVLIKYYNCNIDGRNFLSTNK